METSGLFIHLDGTATATVPRAGDVIWVEFFTTGHPCVSFVRELTPLHWHTGVSPDNKLMLSFWGLENQERAAESLVMLIATLFGLRSKRLSVGHGEGGEQIVARYVYRLMEATTS